MLEASKCVTALGLLALMLWPLRRLGISQTEAIRMFFFQVVLRKGLPFAVSLESEDNDDLLLPRAKWQVAIDAVDELGAVYRVDLGIAGKLRFFDVVFRHDDDPPRVRFLREQSCANVQGLQALQFHELQGQVGRFTASAMDVIRVADAPLVHRERPRRVTIKRRK
ncbi:MAG: hypothetical protein WCI38_01595 [Chthoniobacterales bacterium]